ncbi:hypothetical protein ES706_02357 [subsurface metagenome]
MRFKFEHGILLYLLAMAIVIFTTPEFFLPIAIAGGVLLFVARTPNLIIRLGTKIVATLVFAVLLITVVAFFMEIGELDLMSMLVTGVILLMSAVIAEALVSRARARLVRK